jgi:hypothetical protein
MTGSEYSYEASEHGQPLLPSRIPALVFGGIGGTLTMLSAVRGTIDIGNENHRYGYLHWSERLFIGVHNPLN